MFFKIILSHNSSPHSWFLSELLSFQTEHLWINFIFYTKTSHTSSGLFWFVHIYDKIWTAFIFSCRPPLQGWRHLRWSPRSPCRTCSSPGCCTCRSPTCSRRWWWSWRTCPMRTWGCSGRRTWSPCRSSARWPLAQGRLRCCRSDWGPGERIAHKHRILYSYNNNVQTCRVSLCMNQQFTFPSCMVTTSGRPPATRARPERKKVYFNYYNKYILFTW